MVVAAGIHKLMNVSGENFFHKNRFFGL